MNVCEGAVYRYLQSLRKIDGGIHTHLLLTGGTAIVPDETWTSGGVEFKGLMEFYSMWANHMDNRGILPCVHENRTAFFPFYADLDWKVNMMYIDDEYILKIVSVMATQLMKFYPDQPNRFKCIVCTKTGGADAVDDSKYKHGIHIHWPNVIVDVDRARQIRVGMISGLNKVKSELGNPNLEDCVDAAVYNTGLRMIGAPKASKCKACKKNSHDPCDVCHRLNFRHIIDPRAYGLRMALEGAQRSFEYEQSLRNKTALLVRSTSVRTNKPLTEPYKVYEGGPSVPDAKRKRKDDFTKMDMGFKRRSTTVSDPVKIKVISDILVKFSPHYKESRLRVHFDTVSYRVLMDGDGATFCLNKGGFHKSQNVFMIIEKGRRSDRYEAVMKCWCKCQTKRATGRMCCQYFSDPKQLERTQVNVLFASSAPSSSSSTMRDLMRDQARYIQSRQKAINEDCGLFDPLDMSNLGQE